MNINPEHYFILCNGHTIRDLNELAVLLKKMDKQTFEYHVNNDKNDFANWIQYVFKQKKLAERIADYNYSERHLIIKSIKKFLEEKKVLVLNAGSSSLKFQLLEVKSRDLLMRGSITSLNTDKCVANIYIGDQCITRKIDIKNHYESLNLVLSTLFEFSAIGDVSDIKAIGHRVVHGGEKYKKPVLITDEVLNNLRELSSLAPLHNPSNIECITACLRLNVPQVAVFDTAFHSTIPKEKYLYGLPYKYYEENNIRKYGFHGINHQYITSLIDEFYKIERKKYPRLIICHLGNGCSITAVKDGKSLNTTMGFTPVDGLIMGTRVGHIDPVVSIHLGEHLNISYKEMSRILNKESGLLGICGYNDMRDVWKNRKNPRCKLALEMFTDRLIHYIGAYVAEMNGLDAIVFTGGIGENAYYVREAVLENMKYLGTIIDKKKNLKNEFIITRKDSKITAFVMQANEEIQIALETKKLLKL